MALFSILISPLNAFPWVINGLMEAWVSTKRIQAFLKLSELDLDEYYSSMQDVVDSTADDDDRGSNSSPGSDSQHRQITKTTETAASTCTTEVPVHVHVHADAPQHGNGLEPSTSCPVEEVHVERDMIGVSSRSQPDKIAVGDDGNLLQLNAALAERRTSVGRGRQRRRNRVIVVRNGRFTWSRKDRERVAEPNNSESRGKKKGRAVGNRSKASVESKEKTADSAEDVAHVEWVLSDLNITIYSVHILCPHTVAINQYTYSIFYN